MNLDPATAPGAVFRIVAAAVFNSRLLFNLGVICAKIAVPSYSATVYEGVRALGFAKLILNF
jgi:hypothetical protein